mmetsp:Transcript_7828/g.13709  ORF Transcript_7828/g.13709 Transcript_7828/m.13709 type:complete len:200 (+) Transcript_7828:2078-2677(+)
MKMLERRNTSVLIFLHALSLRLFCFSHSAFCLLRLSSPLLSLFCFSLFTAGFFSFFPQTLFSFLPLAFSLLSLYAQSLFLFLASPFSFLPLFALALLLQLLSLQAPPFQLSLPATALLFLCFPALLFSFQLGLNARLFSEPLLLFLFFLAPLLCHAPLLLGDPFPLCFQLRHTPALLLLATQALGLFRALIVLVFDFFI